MSLFIATGSNLNNKLQNLSSAKIELQKYFKLIAESRVYTSKAVDYENQDDFFNQVLEFETPKMTADAIMNILFEIEKNFGRIRNIPKGPRTLDLDILFIDDLEIQTKLVNIPHPRLFERSFVVFPLSELPGFETLKKKYNFNFKLTNEAFPI